MKKTVTKKDLKRIVHRMNKTNKYLERIQLLNDKALYPDGFEDAIVGIITSPNVPHVLLLSVKKCIKILKKQGMSTDEASEYLYFNVISAALGENTPMYLDDIE